MTHAYARGGGEMPTPRGSDEPRRGVAVAAKRALRKRRCGQAGDLPVWSETSPPRYVALVPDSAGPYRLPARYKDRLSAALEGRKKTGMPPLPSRCSWPGSGAARGGCYARSRSTGGPWPARSPRPQRSPGAWRPRGPRRGGVPGPVRARGRQEVPAHGGRHFSAGRSCIGSGRSMPSRSRQRMPALRQPAERQRHPQAGTLASQPQRAPAPNVAAPRPCPHPKSPKNKTLGGSRVIMGEEDRWNPTAVCEGLEAALERLRRGVCS